MAPRLPCVSHADAQVRAEAVLAEAVLVNRFEIQC